MPFDIHNSYQLLSLMEEITPVPAFFKDRYFPTGAGDLFSTDYVLTEFMEAGRKMAAFVAPRVGDIPVERGSYEINMYQPPKIAPSRVLTIDDLAKKGFGEAPFAGLTPEQRAARIVLQDLTDLERRIAFREEWMAAQAIISNGFQASAYADEDTAVDSYDLKFYNELTSGHIYAGNGVWTTFAEMEADVFAMCNDLAEHGLPATDLLLGGTAASTILGFSGLADRLNKTSGIITGEIDQKLTQYPGVILMGQLNFGGYILNVWNVLETYTADNGTTTAYFPAKAAAVTSPAAGRMLYGAVTQINRGAENFSTITATRVPKLVVDDVNDKRKLRLTARPLPMPKNKNPWRYFAQCVT